MNNEEKRKDWLEKRKHYITGTDVACIMGCSKWGSALTVWLNKKGEGSEIEESEPMYWGRVLEDKILERYAEVNGLTEDLFDNLDGYELHTNDAYPLFACSLDGWDNVSNCPVDAKNIRMASSEWGEDGSSDIPLYYKMQLAVQMMITDSLEARLAVLFSGQEFRQYVVYRDLELEERIVAECTEFWSKVENDIMPTDVGGDDRTTATIKEMYKEGEEGKVKEKDDKIVSLVNKLMDSKAELKAVEEKVAKLENEVKLWMGFATECPGVCTWKNSKGKTTTDWKSVAASYASDSKYEEIVKSYTKTGAGSRSLRITMK